MAFPQCPSPGAGLSSTSTRVGVIPVRTDLAIELDITASIEPFDLGRNPYLLLPNWL